jgi:biopolymer transport protein ExbD
MTPMIDVVFLLIIFFMTAARFAEQTRADLELPKEAGEQEEAAAEAGVVVNIDAEGRISIAQRELDLAGLAALIQEEIDVAGTGAVGFKLTLRADERADAKHLNEIIEQLQTLGVGAAHVATEVP